MIKVFIGGSRRVTRLNGLVRQRLDEIIRKEFLVLIGDANGADKAVQEYLRSRQYDRVEVFCTEGHCRNNVGGWAVRTVMPSRGSRRDFEYYVAKDRRMTGEASVGFMLWDGKSRGTLANIARLVEQGKKAVVYLAPMKEFRIVRNADDWQQFQTAWAKDAPPRLEHPAAVTEGSARASRQHGLF